MTDGSAATSGTRARIDDARLIRWLGSAAGIARVDRRVGLAGGISSRVERIEGVDAAGTPGRWIVRLLIDRAWNRREPDLAEHEHAALRVLASEPALGAPKPVAVHLHAEPGLPPAVVMTERPGAMLLPASPRDVWLDAIARRLVAIHESPLPSGSFRWRWRSWTLRMGLAPPRWSRRPDAWRQAIERTRQAPPTYRPVLVHRDYHPLNLLWTGRGRTRCISGVVDWVNACVGPRWVDVAHCRLNLVHLYGVRAADRFLDAYLRHAGDRVRAEWHPWWECDAALGVLPEPRWYPPWSGMGRPSPGIDRLRARVDAWIAAVAR